MIKSWTDGLTKKQVEDIRDNFGASSLIRLRLSEMLNKKIDSTRNASRAKDGYANPNWALVQADTIGYERALKEVIHIISSTTVE